MNLAQALSVWMASYGPAVYLLLFVLVTAEIGIAPLFFLPGDPLLFLCGALGAQGALDPWLLALLFFAAGVLGNAMAYGCGVLVGRQALRRNYRWLNGEALARAQRFFEGWGGWGLMVTPYVAVLRTFAPLAAGMAGMDRRRFALATLAGAALWSVGLVAAGYFLGNVPFVREHLAGLALSGVVLAAVLAVLKRMSRRLFKRG